MDHALNWIWQGIAIAVATFVLLRALGRARARDRFMLCALALGAVLALPVIALARALAAPRAGPAEIVGAATGPVVTLPAAWWTADAVLLAALFAWAAAQLIRFTGAVLALRRLRAGCRPFAASAESRLPHWTRVKHHGRPARLVLSTGVRSAAVLGGGPPLIAVSPALVERLTPDDLDRVIVHEWAHVQRRDDLLLIAQITVQAVAGWHPGVWWIQRQLRIEREAACDEMVIGLCGSGKSYAASLATLATLPLPRRGALALGAISQAGLEDRVIRILSYGRLAPPSRSARVALTAAVLLGIVSVATAELRLVGPSDVLATVGPEPRPAGLAEQGRGSGPGAGTRFDSAPVHGIAAASASVSGGAPHVLGRPALDAAAVRRTKVAERRLNTAQLFTSGPDVLSDDATDAERRAAPPPAMAGPESADDTEPLPASRASAPAGVAPVAPPSAPPARAEPPSPLRQAGGAGTAVGRGAREAGAGTAGFLIRFGKRIATSF